LSLMIGDEVVSCFAWKRRDSPAIALEFTDVVKLLANEVVTSQRNTTSTWNWSTKAKVKRTKKAIRDLVIDRTTKFKKFF